MVLIDGGALGTFSVPTLSQREEDARRDREGDPFVDLLGLGLPWAAGVFAETAGCTPQEAGGAECDAGVPALARRFQDGLPRHERGGDRLRVRPDHLAEGPRALSACAPARSPRAATRGRGRTARSRRSRTGEDLRVGAAQRDRVVLPPQAHPGRDGAAELSRTDHAFPRAAHETPQGRGRSALRIPTDLTRGRVLRRAKRFVSRSDVPRSKYASDPRTSHLDPLTAAPGKSEFLRTVVPFLKSLR